MKKLILLLLTLCSAGAQVITIPQNHVNTYEDLLNYPYFAEGKSVTCADPIRGGSFQLTADGTGFDGVTKIVLNTPGQFAKRTDTYGFVNALWGPSVRETFLAVSNCIVYLPPGNYPVTEPLTLNNGTHLIGKGARFYNAATNVPGLILMDMRQKRDIIVEDITFDTTVGADYRTGNYMLRGCTNITTRNCTFDNGGYFANYVVVSNGTNELGEKILSEDCVAVRCIFGDQIYGGSGISTAAISVAEGSRRCHILECSAVYDTVGKLGIVYAPTPSDQHPQAPRLIASIDRGFECNVRNFSVVNPSKMPNLAGLTFEDNSGATNIFNTIDDISIHDVDIGVQLTLYDGRFRASRLLVENCTRWGFKAFQAEEADKHHIAEVQLDQPIFINCYPEPSFGKDANDHYFSNAGQVVWGASLPYKMTINNGQFVSYSANPKYTHILHNSGELILNNCTFSSGTWAVRVPDPVDPNIEAPNGYYEAWGKYRKLWATGCRFINVQDPVYGQANPFGDVNFADNQQNSSLRSYFFKELNPNTLSDLFNIYTIKSDRSTVGKSGGYGAKLRLFVSNGNTNDFKIGDVFSQYIEGGWNHAVQENSANSFATNSSFTPSLVTVPAKTGARGFTNIVIYATNLVWHTATVKFQANAINSDTPKVYVYGVVDLMPSGFWQPPQIDINPTFLR